MEKTQKRSLTDRFLGSVERIGNLLPHPATLFAGLAILVVIISWIVSFFDLSVVHPGTQATVKPFNLISKTGLDMILKDMITNFTSFAPLGTVLVSLLGIGVAERSGLISSVLRMIVLASPKKLLTFVIVFAGVLSNAASDVGYVVLIPLAAIIFLAAGRHPVAGLAAAFAGVSGGFSANLVIGTIDPLLAGLSEAAAQIIDPEYTVNPASNYYFMFVSTFLVAALGTWVTERIIVPRIGEYDGDEKAIEIEALNKDEKKGLRYALIASIVFTVLVLIGIIPENGVLRGEDGSVLRSPFMSGIVALIFLGATIVGIAYGVGAKTIKSDADVMDGMGKAMETMGSYIVLVFFAAQFVAYFNWTNLGIIVAVKGAGILQNSGLGPIPLMLSFVVVSALINLIMGSASAKWAIMAPVFIPMFMLLGYSPELVQVAYRVGDSVTNVISPLMSYLALIIVFIQRYDKKAGMGTIISTMLPYSIIFFIGWSILIMIWIWLGLPIGPGANLHIDISG